jgi:hypothetical protein
MSSGLSWSEVVPRKSALGIEREAQGVERLVEGHAAPLRLALRPQIADSLSRAQAPFARGCEEGEQSEASALASGTSVGHAVARQRQAAEGHEVQHGAPVSGGAFHAERMRLAEERSA